MKCVMNQYISDYVEKLRRIISDEDVIELYHWFWDKQDEIACAAEEINRTLGLYGKYALKSDLPCLTMGSRSGLVCLLVNPGWRQELNISEDAHCRKSKDDYVDLMFNFFVKHPEVVGERITFAAQIISFVGLLREGQDRFGHIKTTTEKWQRANSSRLVGHWEIFPFHSVEDGMSQ